MAQWADSRSSGTLGLDLNGLIVIFLAPPPPPEEELATATDVEEEEEEDSGRWALEAETSFCKVFDII